MPPLRAPAAVAVVAIALAALGALSVPDQWAAYAQSDPAQCPSTSPGSDCTYHVTETFPIGNIGAWHLAVDPDNERIYVGTEPYVGGNPPNNASILYAFDLGYRPVGSIAMQGDMARIVDMEVDGATGQLYVLHRWMKNATAVTGAIDIYGGLGSWGLNVTAVDPETLAVNGTSQVRQIETWRSGQHEHDFSYYDARSADLAVGSGGMILVSSGGSTPVAVMNGSAPGRPHLELMGSPDTDGGRANAEAVHISAMAVNASAGQTVAYVVSREYRPDQPVPYEASLTTIRFNASGAFQDYERLDREGVGEHGDQRADILSREAREIILDDTRDRLFVLWEQNHSVSMYSLDTERNATLGVGLPRFVMTLNETDGVGGEGTHNIALDEKNGILYSVVQDYSDPRIVAHDSGTGDFIAETSLSDQPIAIAVDKADGTVYATPWWSPHAYVVDPRPATALQGMIDAAPRGGTVVVGPGLYVDEVLVIDKPLTLTSPTGQPGAARFTGHSRIQVEADNVTVRGMYFEDTGCLPGLAASLVEIGLPAGASWHGSSLANVTIESSVFRDTCHAGIQQEGAGNLAGVQIRNNLFEGIGLKPAPGSDRPLDTGGEDEWLHNHGAIALAYHPGQGSVRDSAISGNTILGTSAAGIRVFKADNVTIADNYIRDTPASAIGMSHGSRDSRVTGNIIANANSEPDFDYLDGVNGSGDGSYYVHPSHNRPDGHEDDWWLEEWFVTVPAEKPTPDAAIKVWANSQNVAVTGNTIMGSNGAFVLCAGTCAAESDGIVHAGTRNVLPVDDASTNPAARGISFTGNVVYGDNRGDIVANNATSNATTGGALDATGNTFVGLGGNDEVRTRGNVDLGGFLHTDPEAVAPPFRPATAFRAGGAGAGPAAVGDSALLVDAERNLIYAGASPDGGNATLYVHNMTDHSLIGSYALPGPQAAIADMDLDEETGRLYVLHRWLANETAVALWAWDFFQGRGAWGLNLTVIDAAAAPGSGGVTASGPPISIRHASGTAHGNPSWFALQHASNAKVSTAGSLAFVTTPDFLPIVAINMSADAPSAAFMPGDGNGNATHVSAIAADGTVAYVYSRQYYDPQLDGQTYWSSVTTVRFNSSGVGTSFGEYERVSRAALAPGEGEAREIILDKDRASLFVNLKDGSLMLLKLSETVSGSGGGMNITVPGNATVFLGEGSRITDISLDREAGILYALAAASGSSAPRLLAYNSTTGDGIGAPSPLTAAGAPDAVSVYGGMAYAAQSDRAEVLVMTGAKDARSLQAVSVFGAGPAANAAVVGDSALLVDAERNLIYAGASPAGGNATLYVHNMEDYSLIGSYALPGPRAAIADMDLDEEAGRLYVLHRWLANETAVAASWVWDFFQGRGAWGLNLTVIDVAAAPGSGGVTASGPPISIRHASGTAHGNPSWFALQHASNAKVSTAGSLAFVTTPDFLPIVAINMSADAPSAAFMQDAGNEDATHVSAIAADGTVAYVYSRQYYDPQLDGQTYWSSVTTVRFNSSSIATGDYDRVSRAALAPGEGEAREIILDKDRASLFVNLKDGSLMLLKLSETVSGSGGGMGIKVPSNATVFLGAGSRITDISLDREAGILYALAAASASSGPRLLAYNSTTGDGIGAPSSLLGGMPDAVYAAAGMAYVANADRPEMLALADRAGGNVLQAAIDAAPSGSAIAVPPGAYADAVLLVSKPLTLTSAAGGAGGGGPVFGGASRIYVDADDVAVRGLAFSGTECAPGSAAVLQVLAPGGQERSGVAIENNMFSDTCSAAVQTYGLGALDGILVRGNQFANIGLPRGGAATSAGGEDVGGDTVQHGAVGLAYDPGQSEVRNARILSNTIENTSAAGIRVFNARDALVYDNRIEGTPASAVGLSYGSSDSAVLGNTVAGANTRASAVPDAAVKVWADSRNVAVAGNTISRSGGAMAVCAGACGMDGAGLAPASARLDPLAYNVSGDANRIAFNWNVVRDDNRLNGAALIANNGSGLLDATRNYYPGYAPSDADVHSATSVDYSAPARSVSGLSTNASGRAGTGATVYIDLAFSMPDSLIVPEGAAPSFQLDVASSVDGRVPDAAAVYSGAINSTAYRFMYTVEEGDSAPPPLRHAVPSSLALNGASLAGSLNPPASLDLSTTGAIAGGEDVEIGGPGPASAVPATAAAAFAGPNMVTITYSAPLGKPDGYADRAYGNVTIEGGERMPVSESGLGGSRHTVVFGGAGVDRNQTGTIALNTVLVGVPNGTGARPVFEGMEIPIAAGGEDGRMFVAAEGDLAPVVPIGPGSFVRIVNATAGGDGARPAINVTELGPESIKSNGTVSFPAMESVEIVASFARVSFPPAVTATSVPAGGVIRLYVSDSPPDRAAVAAGFGIADPAAVTVGRVVEAGDDAAQITFDMPVRILLTGQAGGKAFYVDNTDDTVMPIAVACEADDTAAVHAQLNGSGECEIDSGGDKAIHTYHLTRFGAAEIDEDAIPRPPIAVETYPATALVNATAGAAAGGTVAVPAGEYGEDVLIVNKSLTIEPADPAGSPPVLTGYSHIVVRPAEADGPIVIRGIAFMNTTYTPAGAGRASIMIESRAGALPANATVQPVVIEGNTFANTCDSAIRAEADQGAPPIAGLVIRNNTFYGIGSNTAGCEPAPARADAISAGGAYDGRFEAGAAQLRGLSILDNYIFGTTSTGIRVSGADGLVVAGNHIEGVPDDGIRILPSGDAVVQGNTIVGANNAPYMPGTHDGAAGAAIEVWSGSDDVAVSLNRISGSAGAFRVCAGTCDPGAAGSSGAPVQVAASDIGSADGANDIRFNHNVIAASNTGALIANDAGGMLNARANYYPGHAMSPAVDALYLASPSRSGGTVQVAPTLADAGPVSIGAIVADGAASPVRSSEAAVRAAFELGIRDFNAMQAAVGGFVGLEPAVRSVQSPDYTPSAQAEHVAALEALRTGAGGDARMLPVLHYSISTAMAAYDGNATAALAGISAMGATYGHYPFVTSRDGIIVAHGANASLVGDSQIVRSLAGGTDAALAALFDFQSAESGVAPGYPGTSWKWWTYNFTDPASDAGETRSKRSVIALHPGPDGTLHNDDDLVFGAGYYPQGPPSHMVVSAGDAPAAVNASDGMVIVSPTSTAAQLAAPDMLFRLAPPDSQLAGVVVEAATRAQAAGGRASAVIALNDSASLQSMGLAGELARLDREGALPDRLTSGGVTVVSYDSSAAGWEAGAADDIRSAAGQQRSGVTAVVYSGRAGAFADLAAAFGNGSSAQPPARTAWYATGELGRDELASISSPSVAPFARAANLVVISQHASPSPALDAALAASGMLVAALDDSTRGAAYAAYDAARLLGRAITSTADVPGSPADVASAIQNEVVRTHSGALGSTLVLDGNGDLVLPVTYALSSFPTAAGGDWGSQDQIEGERTCGILLAKSLLDFGIIAPGQRSRIDTQTVINTGTLPYDTVTLSPTGWMYAGANAAILPASLTQMRELGDMANFVGLADGREVASNLDPGMSSRIQYRLDLTANPTLEAGMISQTVNYSVECKSAS